MNDQCLLSAASSFNFKDKRLVPNFVYCIAIIATHSPHINILCPSSSSAQIDPEKYPEQKLSKTVDPAKELSPVESSLNFSPRSSIFLSK